MTTTPRKPLFSSDYQFDILICLGLILAIFIPYHQVAGHRFVEFDDGIYAYQNTYIMRGLCWDSLCWAFTNTDSANWHPLTWMSHLVDREMFTSHPGGYLLENVAWHALASCLCYLAFFKTTGSRLFAFWVALIFAVHPVNVENVAWMSERKSLLNATFWFCAIISYLDFIEIRSFRAYGVTAIAFILSLLSKPMSVTLPCTLVLIHALYLVYHPDRRHPSPRLASYLKELVLPVVPLLAVTVYFSAVTMSAQAQAMNMTSFTVDLRLINMALSYGRYLRMFFSPTGLAIFYPFRDGELSFRAAIPAIVILSAVSVGTLLLIRKKPQLLIGWCWYLGTMVPAIGFVQVGSQSHADRYLYIPMLGLAFVFPVLLEEIRSVGVWAKRTISGICLAVLGVSMIAATQIQVSYWKDGVALFRHSLNVTGDCSTSVINLAVALHRMGSYSELLAFADSRIPTATMEYKGRLAAIKASCLYYIGKPEAAVATAKQSLAWGDNDITPFWTLAVANLDLGRLDEASLWLSKGRAQQKPVNQVSLIDVEHDVALNGLEMLIKQRALDRIHAHPQTLIKPSRCGGRIETW